jgi:threonine dehydratase
MSYELINISTIKKAQIKIKELIIKTSFSKNDYYSELFDCSVFLKREDLQQVKSFKIRGAYNKLSSLSKIQLKKGVVCSSAGNHAQGFALACKKLETYGTVFMPISTPKQKIKQVKKFGKKFIKVVLVGDNYDEANIESKKFALNKKKIFIHPFDDTEVIAGQATLFLEIINQFAEKLDYLFIPIGGGGLISGALSVFKQLSPTTKIIGVEPYGAPSMYVSLKNKKNTTLNYINNFVDGAAVKRVGEISFNLCNKYLDDIILIDEGEICQNILDLVSKVSIIVEPAGAMSIGALKKYKKNIKNKKVGCIICGGNIDSSRMKDIKEKAKLWSNTKNIKLAIK